MNNLPNNLIKKFYSMQCDDLNIDCRYFVNWHYHLWAPAVIGVIGDPKRFRGKSVLEIGCGDGRMSCLFGLLGATVLGVDVDNKALLGAWKEVDRWSLHKHVSFEQYDGDPLSITGQSFDYVFTKSVLIMIPNLEEYLFKLQTKIISGGELLLVENLYRGIALRRIVRRVRRLIRFRSWVPDPWFNIRGVNEAFLSSIRKSFDIVEFKKYYGLVAAIRARKIST